MSWKNIWGYFSENDARMYQDWARAVPDGATVVELGTLMGRSAACFLEACEAAGKPGVKMVCIDFWPQVNPDHQWWVDGGVSAFKGDTLAACRHNLVDWRHRVRCVQYDVRDAARLFLAGSVWGVFIDAGHDYDCVNACISEWTPKIVPGGRIGGHDYNPESWPGVVRAVDATYGHDGFTRYGSCWHVQK